MRFPRGLRMLAVASALGGAARAGDPAPLKVLYAGNPGSEREKDFVALLKPAFVEVATTDYRTFVEEKAAGHDVVIFDWTSIYPRDRDGKVLEKFTRMNYPATPKLSDNYDRPTILIGGPGERVVRPLRTKIGWLCLCLDDAAHGVATGHDIFRTPRVVSPTFADIPTPPDYPALNSGKPIGPTIRAWKVQVRKHPELDPGLVSDGFMFEDSPDAEIIASGLNMKGPASVALGRHGNFLLWGFSAAPSDMTPEARDCFLNAVSYIRRFDGQKPIVRVADDAFSRGRARMVAHFTRTVFDPQAYRRIYPEAAREQPDYLNRQRKAELSAIEARFPKEVRHRANGDPGAYVAWVEENYDWLRPGPDRDGITEIVVDADVKALGVSNHEVALLDACVAMLERGDRGDLARRILGRYTKQDFADAKGWRTWLDDCRDRLFFTEAGGYVFQEAPRGMTPPARPARTPLNASLTPTRREPVVAESECIPARVRAGEVLTVVVRVAIAPTWHIAPLDGSRGPEAATSLASALPPHLETDGDWSRPEPIRDAEGRRSYVGTVEFRRRLRVAKQAPAGPIAATFTLGYQACDPFSCRPQAETSIEAKVEVIGD